MNKLFISILMCLIAFPGCSSNNRPNLKAYIFKEPIYIVSPKHEYQALHSIIMDKLKNHILFQLNISISKKDIDKSIDDFYFEGDPNRFTIMNKNYNRIFNSIKAVINGSDKKDIYEKNNLSGTFSNYDAWVRITEMIKTHDDFKKYKKSIPLTMEQIKSNKYEIAMAQERLFDERIENYVNNKIDISEDELRSYAKKEEKISNEVIYNKLKSHLRRNLLQKKKNNIYDKLWNDALESADIKILDDELKPVLSEIEWVVKKLYLKQ